jgi:hypothetical protein
MGKTVSKVRRRMQEMRYVRILMRDGWMVGLAGRVNRCPWMDLGGGGKLFLFFCLNLFG